MDYEDYAAILHNKDEDYYIIKKIGEGATSFVYLSLNNKDISTEKYAIKLYIDEQAYQTETLLLKKIPQNKNIVKLITYGVGFLERGSSLENYEITSYFSNEEVKFAVLEYLPNGELFNYIKIPEIGFNEEISRKIFSDLLEAVEACHKSGISHGDIKLENILLTEDFKIKLIDFGFSRNINDGLIYENIGTSCYISPEVSQAPTKGFDGIKNDIFSMGVVLFILIFGFFPFDNATFADNRYKFIINDKFEEFWKLIPFNQIDISISNNFKDLFEKLVCYDPKGRLSLNEIKMHSWIHNNHELFFLPLDDCSINHSHNGNLNKFEDEYLKEFQNRKNLINDALKE